MPLFLIQDSDRPAYVVACNYQEAIGKWKKAVGAENGMPSYEVEDPLGAEFLAKDKELIIDDDFVSAKPRPKLVSEQTEEATVTVSTKDMAMAWPLRKG